MSFSQNMLIFLHFEGVSSVKINISDAVLLPDIIFGKYLLTVIGYARVFYWFLMCLNMMKMGIIFRLTSLVTVQKLLSTQFVIVSVDMLFLSVQNSFQYQESVSKLIPD